MFVLGSVAEKSPFRRDEPDGDAERIEGHLFKTTRRESLPTTDVPEIAQGHLAFREFQTSGSWSLGHFFGRNAV